MYYWGMIYYFCLYLIIFSTKNTGNLDWHFVNKYLYFINNYKKKHLIHFSFPYQKFFIQIIIRLSEHNVLLIFYKFRNKMGFKVFKSILKMQLILWKTVTILFSEYLLLKESIKCLKLSLKLCLIIISKVFFTL